MRVCHLRAKSRPFVLNKISLLKAIIITFIYLLALFIVQNVFKKSHSGFRVMRIHHFWAQNGPFVQNKSFFGKLLISAVSRAILEPVYRFGIPNSDPKFLKMLDQYFIY